MILVISDMNSGKEYVSFVASKLDINTIISFIQMSDVHTSDW